MMFPLAHGQTVDRERRHLVLDPYSDEYTKADWTNPDTIELEGVLLAPSSSVEPSSETRSQRITQMSIYCAPTDDVLPEDRIRVGTVVWEVVSEVNDWKNAFTGWNPGKEFSIKKVKG